MRKPLSLHIASIEKKGLSSSGQARHGLHFTVDKTPQLNITTYIPKGNDTYRNVSDHFFYPRPFNVSRRDEAGTAQDDAAHPSHFK